MKLTQKQTGVGLTIKAGEILAQKQRRHLAST